MDDFTNHPSVQLIEQKSTGCDKFDFQGVNPTRAERVLESLDANKATGHDGIFVKVLKTGAKEISLSLSTIYNSCIKKVSGHVTGKKGTGTSLLKTGQERQREYRPVTVLSCETKCSSAY